MSFRDLTRIELIAEGVAFNSETVGQLVRFINNTSEVVQVDSTATYQLTASPSYVQPGDFIEFYWTGRHYAQLLTRPSVLVGEVNVLDYAADNTGVEDCVAAFTAAIAALGAGGRLILPAGIYRFSSTLHLKKPIHMLGVNSGWSGGSTIAPDNGVEAIRLERSNTPRGTLVATGADGTTFENILFYGASWKADIWAGSHSYAVGDVVKQGPAPHQGAATLGSNFPFGPYPHYKCTKPGVSGSTGPLSLGYDYTLNYTGLSGTFEVGDYVVGGTSGAEGIIIADTGSQLRITGVSRTAFINGEALSETVDGIVVATATASGTNSLAAGNEVDGTAEWEYIGKGCAIKARTPWTAINCTINGSSGCGIVMENGDPEDPGAFTNSNGWNLINTSIIACDGHGLYIEHSDSQGGNVYGGQIGGNGGTVTDEDFGGPGFNFYDQSFLGNTYVGVEFFTTGGQGAIYSNNQGGGSAFWGCYQEGTGGGHSIMSNDCVVVGGGLSVSNIRGTGAPTFGVSTAVRIAPNAGYGQIFTILGYGGAPWRASVYKPLGVLVTNNGNVYQCSQAGTTNSSGGPTGTGTGITDGTCKWDFVHAVSNGDGVVQLGSGDPALQAVSTTTVPDDAAGNGLSWYDKYDASTGFSTFTRAQRYGISGPHAVETEGNGVGLMIAQNKTVWSEWPMKIPAGKAMFDQFWVGGCRIQYSATTTDPAEGAWNPGDRMYYKGAACVSGGAEGKVCVTAGTQGTYAGGRTATADGSSTIVLSGSAMGVLLDAQEFTVGDWVTVGGSARRQVLAVSSDGRTLTLSGTVSAGAGKAMLFSAATFKEFGSIA